MWDQLGCFMKGKVSMHINRIAFQIYIHIQNQVVFFDFLLLGNQEKYLVEWFIIAKVLVGVQ